MKPRKCILRMLEIDQRLRRKPDSQLDDKEWRHIDRAHVTAMRLILRMIGGWPTISKVGTEASLGASLIVRHMDRYVGFQGYCLKLMCKEPEREVPESEIAFMYDRIQVNLKRPQFFGTQFSKNEQGAYGPRPIRMPESVDERRASIGLCPIAEYKNELMLKYGIKQ